MSSSAKREALARIHGRYQRAGRLHKTRILEMSFAPPADITAKRPCGPGNDVNALRRQGGGAVGGILAPD